MMTPARCIVISACFLTGLLAIVMSSFGRIRGRGPADEGMPPTPDARRPVPAATSRPQALQRIMEQSEELNAPSSSADADVMAVRDLVRGYRRMAKSNPVGDNDEITAQLLGRHARGPAVMLIAPNNRAIDGGGRLVDRWGTPYFFHALSSSAMEVRSAGPDRRMWTADDVVDGGL